MLVRLAVVVVTLVALFYGFLYGPRARVVETRRLLGFVVPVFLVSPTLLLWFYRVELPFGYLVGTGAALSFLLLAGCGIWARVRGRTGSQEGRRR